MNYVKSFFYFAASAVLLALFSGCARTPAAASAPVAAATVKGECVQEGVIAPSWVCKPQVADAYAGLGMAQKNGADKAQAIQVALYNGRAEIVKQIQSKVREKLNNFARTPEGNNKEKVDNLYESIANAAQPMNVHLEKTAQSWTTPSGKVYVHAIAPKSSFDADLKRAVELSHMNDQVTWLSFNSRQSITKLEKEFDVKLAKVESVKVAKLFQVETVSDMIVGRNRKH